MFSRTLDLHLLIAAIDVRPQVLTAQAFVFCSRLQSVAADVARTTAMNFTIARDTRPTTPDWPAAAPTGSAVYVTATVQ